MFYFLARHLFKDNKTIKTTVMNDLKTQLSTLKALAKELMKIGNLQEYFSTIKKVNKLEQKLQLKLVKI